MVMFEFMFALSGEGNAVNADMYLTLCSLKLWFGAGFDLCFAFNVEMKNWMDITTNQFHN